jgi:hypothetical protein
VAAALPVGVAAGSPAAILVGEPGCGVPAPAGAGVVAARPAGSPAAGRSPVKRPAIRLRAGFQARSAAATIPSTSNGSSHQAFSRRRRLGASAVGAGVTAGADGSGRPQAWQKRASAFSCCAPQWGQKSSWSLIVFLELKSRLHPFSA